MTIRTVALLRSLVDAAALAQTTPAPTPQAQPAVAAPAALTPTAIEKNNQVAYDLRALSRIAGLAKDLGDTRQVMLAILDNDIDMLRERRPDDTYKWASLQREEASRVKDEKTIERVQTEKELR